MISNIIRMFAVLTVYHNHSVMKTIHLSINYVSCTFSELSSCDQQLVEAAQAACKNSYAPYSHFSVGAAAALDNGEIISGSNQENAAFPSGTCAERCTVFYANSQYPQSAVHTLAIAAIGTDGKFTAPPISPCGACRQVLLETEQRFKTPMRVILYGTNEIFIIRSCSELLPFQFDQSAL